MNPLLVSLNEWSSRAFGQAWPMLWQSSLLILLVLALDLALSRRLRPAIRYALWLVVLVKLVLPPSLASPSGIGWWVLKRAAPGENLEPRSVAVSVTYGPPMPGPWPQPASSASTAAPAGSPSLSLIAMATSLSVSLVLLTLMMFRWRALAVRVQGSTPAPDWLVGLLDDCRQAAGVGHRVQLCVVGEAMSPAVCGLFRPLILVPQALVESLSTDQLRPVLLHELIHLRRGDVWVNCVQTLLQLLYWWHPLLWLANARIRRVREEAVDDAVMVALGEETAVYAPTLVEVAKLALQRPIPTLGLVGILESQGALRQRIERLLNFQPPRKAGLTLVSLLSVAAFAALAVPMGPASANRTSGSTLAAATSDAGRWPDPHFTGYHKITLEPRFLIAHEEDLRRQFPSLLESSTPLTYTADEIASLDAKLIQAGARPYTWARPLTFEKFSGGSFRWLIDRRGTNQVNYLTREVGGKSVVTGADTTFTATDPDWQALRLSLTPWFQEGGILCQLQLGLAAEDSSLKETELIIPRRGAIVWAVSTGPGSREYELVVLQEGPQNEPAAAPGNTRPDPKNATNNLLKDAKLLYEMGKPEEAEVKLRAVLQDSPDDKVAAYYLNLIREARFQRERRALKDDSSARTAETPPAATNVLYTRVFKVDSRVLRENLYSAVGAASDGTNGTALQMRKFFSNMGVDLAPPKTFFYADRRGELIVRATLADLGTIETALSVLNSAPPQVNVKVRFVELPVKLAREFWSGITNSESVSSILSESQARVALKALESQDGVKLVGEASVTTLSGRQTQVQTAEEISVVALTNGGSRELSVLGRSPSTNRVTVGSTVDLYPVVRPDGYSVQLTVSASTTEFLGYDDPGPFVPQTDSTSHIPVTAPLPLPHFRLLQIPSCSATLWDAQTLVLGGAFQMDTNKIPVFGGDRPLLGRLFRREPTDKDFIVFITPTLIDPAGNRIHSEAEIPPPTPKDNEGKSQPRPVHPPALPKSGNP